MVISEITLISIPYAIDNLKSAFKTVYLFTYKSLKASIAYFEIYFYGIYFSKETRKPTRK